MDEEGLKVTLEKIHNPLFTDDAIQELQEAYPNAWFVFHPAVGLIIWWPHHNMDGFEGPMPLAMSRMASNIYFYEDQFLHKIKDRNGMNFTVPREVRILQTLLS